MVVSNIPSPYREPIYNIVSKKIGYRNFIVVYCQKKESDREWEIVDSGYRRKYLKKRTFKYNKKYVRHVHFNIDVIGIVARENPDIIITNGYNPTHLFAFAWCFANKKKHIAMTDGWDGSEESLTVVHKMVRKIVLKRSKAFIGASDASLSLYRNYGVSDTACFLSYLCADNELFANTIEFKKRQFHLMFCGQLIERKNVAFFGQLCVELSRQVSNFQCLICGSGPQGDGLISLLKYNGVNYKYAGFVQPNNLPAYYQSAKMFAFPTTIDCWGVVLNEACAAGTVVISTPYTAAVPELIEDGVTGIVRELVIEDWLFECVNVLTKGELWGRISKKSQERVKKYSYNNAAEGIVNALQYVKSIENEQK